MKVFAIFVSIAVFFLVGCDTPKVGFRYTHKAAIAVGRNHFTVFYNDKQAQALRHNRIKLRERAQVQDDAVTATQTVTGCKVRLGSIKGDPGLVEMRLSCPKPAS